MSVHQICLLLLLFATSPRAHGQDPLRFADQIRAYDKQPIPVDEPLIVFTGSSSIRMWKNTAAYFPEYTILNRGFGGSHMSDLLHFAEELIIRYRPSQVFIYEGDNDLGAGKTSAQILSTTKELVQLLQSKLPKMEIVLISPKPSIARWDRADSYRELNRLLAAYAEDQTGVSFADVWSPMIDADGEVMKDIFLKDGLHMNAKGYDIWANVIGPMLRND